MHNSTTFKKMDFQLISKSGFEIHKFTTLKKKVKEIGFSNRLDA